MKISNKQLIMVLVTIVTCIGIWQLRLYLEKDGFEKMTEARSKRIDEEYERSKEVNSVAFPTSDSFPIPVYESDDDVLSNGATPIGYIHPYEQVYYFKREKFGYSIQLNQKNNNHIGYIHFRYRPAVRPKNL